MEEGCPWAERTEELDACKGHPDENGRYKPFTKKRKQKANRKKRKGILQNSQIKICVLMQFMMISEN